MIVWRSGAFGILLALGAPVFAGESPEWRPVNAETGQIRDVEGLRQLARDFPDSGTVRLRMLQPMLAAGEIEQVMETLEWLYDRGYVFSDVSRDQISKLLDGVDPGRIAERLIAEAEVIAPSEVIATIQKEAGLIESVLVVSDGVTLGATSITGNSIFISRPDGPWDKLAPPSAGDLSGIVEDRSNETGWVASSNVDGSEEDAGVFSGLIGLTGDFNNPILIAAPEGVNPSDLTIGDDGTLYTSDPIGGGVFFARQSDSSLQSLVPEGVLRSPQGLTTSEDGSKLYISDYRYGIAVVDLADGDVARLSTELPIILDGVDGLWRHGNELIAVQNGTSPMRISAFELSEDGMSVVGHRVLEQANPEWIEPLNGSIHDGALYYVGNGQWDRYIKGQPAQGKPPLPTQIRRLPLEN